MDITKEDFKKPQTWAFLIPAILLVAALFCWLSMNSAASAANKEIKNAIIATEAANGIIEIKRKSNIDLSDGAGKREFETVSSFIECAEASGITASSMKKLSGEQPKTLRGGQKEYREVIEITNIRIEQLGKFIDFAETNFESLDCTDISISPSANKSSKDRWNAVVQFRHIK